jgi:hypothetical protein
VSLLILLALLYLCAPGWPEARADCEEACAGSSSAAGGDGQLAAAAGAAGGTAGGLCTALLAAVSLINHSNIAMAGLVPV